MKYADSFARTIAALSLDAPVVSAVWLCQLGRMVGLTWSWEAYALLCGAVWCIYVVDRISDGRQIDPAAPAVLRHRFARRFQGWLLAAVGMVAAAGGLLVVTRMPVVLLEGIGVGLLALVYLLLNRYCQREGRPFLAKEPLAALIFALGVALIPFDAAPESLGALSFAVFLFAWLAFYNLILISRWEAAYDQAQGTTSLGTTRIRAERALFYAKTVLFVGTLVLFLGVAMGTALAVGISAVGLYLLEVRGSVVSLPVRRMLADVALLAPVILWIMD